MPAPASGPHMLLPVGADVVTAGSPRVGGVHTRTHSAGCVTHASRSDKLESRGGPLCRVEMELPNPKRRGAANTGCVACGRVPLASAVGLVLGSELLCALSCCPPSAVVLWL